jgi:hypothetical protein
VFSGIKYKFEAAFSLFDKRSAASIDAHYMKPDALQRIGEILATQ